MWLPRRPEVPNFFRGKVCLESEILKGLFHDTVPVITTLQRTKFLDNFKEILIISYGCSILYKEWTRLT